jgi:hypothetical protein
MDEDTGWRPLDPGELVHVDGDGRMSSSVPVGAEPAHLLRLEDLAPHQAASQAR